MPNFERLWKHPTRYQRKNNTVRSVFREQPPCRHPRSLNPDWSLNPDSFSPKKFPFQKFEASKSRPASKYQFSKYRLCCILEKKTQGLWEKLKYFEKKLKLFGFKTQRTGSESLHPATIKVVKKRACTVEFLFPKNFFWTIGFWLGDGIRCLEPEAQNAVLSLEVAKIQFSKSIF